MKAFALICAVVVVVLAVIGAFSVQEGSQAAIIGACGFACLIVALCFYLLADIREVLKQSPPSSVEGKN
jgi:uncharacterized membrane protein YfcA